MPTLQSVLTLATGLYRYAERDGSSCRERLLASLSEGELRQTIVVEKVETGVYDIRSADSERALYRLYSRRRAPR
jgi:hypothetical protein